MVEEHVGKKRRKEVRQAITLQEEARKTLIFMIVMLALGTFFIMLIAFLLASSYIDPTSAVGRYGSIVIMTVVIVVTAPKAGKFYSLRRQYKEHLLRFNISKADMAALKNQD